MSDLLSSNSNAQKDTNYNESEQSKTHIYTCPECKRAARPGELVCYYCGKFLADSSRPDLVETTVLVDMSNATFSCPACQQSCNPGDPVCLHCGKLFVDIDDTNEIDRKALFAPVVRWPAGEISVEDEQPIILDIEGQHLPLPIHQSVVLGRVSIPIEPEDKRPHVDLSSLDALKKGVSREHALILRKHGLIYVVDLGSSNGTVLNGTMLAPYTDRVLRSGDELRLGSFTLRVLFPSAMPTGKRSGKVASQ